ncbi:MAG: DUF1656 domain-containing protein [Myxococcales bacterium]|jgi:hypothetical protein
MSSVPHELALGGVYVPPMLVAAVFGTSLAVVAARLLNRSRLSRHFFYPPLVFVALAVLFTVLVGTFVIPA